MKREEVTARIAEIGLVPVVRVPSAALAVRAVEAVLEGGISIFEITMTVPDALGVIHTLADKFRGRALVGAGTVLSADDARACIDAGAEFIVSPGLDLPTVEAAQARGAAIVPGGLTPTEVITAWKAGADMVKIFPCSAMGGAKYLRALKGPLPQVKMLPTGGVSVATVEEYVLAGASALGIGGELLDVAALEASPGGGDGVVGAIAERARALVVALAAARAKLRKPAS